LRQAGKKVFLGTNSHTEYGNLIMSATLGDDWRQFFDVICCACRKPLYFWDQKPAPFYPHDPNAHNLKGRPINDASEMSLAPHQTYIEGNSKTLSHYFQRLLNTDREVRVAFFGDQYITDTYASSTNPGWDGFAVVEELALYDPELERGVDADHVLYDKFWGKDSYFVEKGEDGTIKKNFFVDQLEDCARYMLPFVKNIDQWMG
jgi:5' nucleotidase family